MSRRCGARLSRSMRRFVGSSAGPTVLTTYSHSRRRGKQMDERARALMDAGGFFEACKALGLVSDEQASEILRLFGPLTSEETEDLFHHLLWKVFNAYKLEQAHRQTYGDLEEHRRRVGSIHLAARKLRALLGVERLLAAELILDASDRDEQLG